jgi:hypothetical protein
MIAELTASPLMATTALDNPTESRSEEITRMQRFTRWIEITGGFH